MRRKLLLLVPLFKKEKPTLTIRSLLIQEMLVRSFQPSIIRLFQSFLSGFGGLSLSIEGPSKAEIQCKDNSDGTLNISYKPTEPGYYIINLKFADHHVNGSPYTVKVNA